MIESVIVLAPLIAAAIAGLLQKQLGDRLAMTITTASVGLALALSLYVFADYVWLGGQERLIELARFIDVGAFKSTWSVRIDTLSAVMLVVVTSVSFLVHVYSWGYMAEDPHRARFFSYLSFFTFAMLALVTANDFLQMFFGWEGVGVASYLLVGFWFDKRSANDAAIKAFVTNRVGDFGFALGIMAAFFAYGSIRFDEVFAAAAANPGMMFNFEIVQLPVVETVAALLFVGAMGKSAQFILHVWLPDAMEGPTPVSALIHAATMVTAGVFMVCRCSSLYELAPYAAGFVTITGAVTALFAATVGLAQNDIKRVVAYSTCSQLGYMFFAAGVGAYGAAMFHLFTHAFFKALLFLGAGSVIIGLHHEQDMRFMGGVRKPMTLTWAMMLIGTLALTGVGIPGTQIGFAGFFSKDAIIESAFAAGENGRLFGQIAFWCGVSAAFLTSFYSWRLLFMTFEGRFHPNPQAHHDAHHDNHAHDAHHAAPAEGVAPAHESPRTMTWPLIALAAGAVLAGVIFAPYFLQDRGDFWRGAIERSHDPLHASSAGLQTGPEHQAQAPHAGSVETEHRPEAPDAGLKTGATGGEAAHHVPTWVMWAPFVVTLSGFLLALPIYFFSQTMGGAIARMFAPINAFLSRKWYFDELYDLVLVKGARALGDLFWKGGDKRLIDGLGPDGFAWVSKFTARQMRRIQTGYVYHYSFLMLVAVAAIGAYAIYAGGALP